MKVFEALISCDMTLKLYPYTNSTNGMTDEKTLFNIRTCVIIMFFILFLQRGTELFQLEKKYICATKIQHS